jgi:hypothetical protein
MAFTRTKLYFSDAEPERVEHAELDCINIASSHGISAATVYHTSGVWRGAREFGFVFEVLDGDETALLDIAAELARRFEQESVALTRETVAGKFELIPACITTDVVSPWGDNDDDLYGG